MLRAEYLPPCDSGPRTQDSRRRLPAVPIHLFAAEEQMKRLTTGLVLLLGCHLINSPATASDKDERERARKATVAFQEIMGAPDQAVPQELLDRCECVAVFPSVKKAGFVVGAQYGKGLISCRRNEGGWGSPAFF